jgi:hypothetical protein
MRKFNIVVHISLSLIMLFWSAPHLVFAQTATSTATSALPDYRNKGVQKSIEDFLCAPTGGGSDLNVCVNRLYRFSISIGGFLLVFLLALAGYYYMLGSESGKQKAKGIVGSSVAGMIIILTSYLILNQINPALTQFRAIQPPIFSGGKLPTCEDVNYGATCTLSDGQVLVPPGGGTGGGGCKNIEQGACTVATLNSCPGMLKDRDLALRICNQESAGGQAGVMSSTDRCRIETNNDIVSFSGGLWQINIENSADPRIFPECQGVLQHVSPGDHCTVRPPYNDVDCTCRYGSGGRAAYDRCVAAIKDPSKNTANACKLFNTPDRDGTEPGIRGWEPWQTSYNKCTRG